MDRILNAIKCMICRETLETPLLMPCDHNVCKKHVLNQTNGVIRCGKCGVEHPIPTNGFILNKALKEIIESGIADIDFGSVHKSAKKSCEYFEDSLKELELLLKDPNAFTHEKITELKDTVQLKGEEIKLIIDQEAKKLIDKLEEYERQSKEYLSSNEFKEESKKLESEMEIAQSNLDSWLENLNE